MASIFGGIGSAIRGAANTAVQASPFVLKAVRDQQDREEATKQRALQQLYQLNQDRRAERNQMNADAMAAANIGRVTAQTDAIRNPSVGVKYTPDANGDLVGLPTKVTGAQAVAPITTGVRAPAKPAPRIDPNSREGIAAAGEKARVVAGAKAPFAKPASQPGVFVADPTNPNAPAVYTPRDQAFGKTQAKSGAGSTSLSPEDRATMVAQARLDNQTMKEYEGKVLASGKPVGVAAGLAGAAAAGGGNTAANALAILGNKATGAIDPDYQKYITAQRSYGRIMGNLQSKRYTDHQAEIERSISGMQASDLPGTIQYKQQLRDASLADLGDSPSSGRGAGLGNVPHPPNTHDTPGNITLGAPSREQQLWDAAVAKYGKDRVLKEYGPRPGGGGDDE